MFWHSNSIDLLSHLIPCSISTVRHRISYISMIDRELTLLRNFCITLSCVQDLPGKWKTFGIKLDGRNCDERSATVCTKSFRFCGCQDYPALQQIGIESIRQAYFSKCNNKIKRSEALGLHPNKNYPFISAIGFIYERCRTGPHIQ